MVPVSGLICLGGNGHSTWSLVFHNIVRDFAPRRWPPSSVLNPAFCCEFPNCIRQDPGASSRPVVQRHNVFLNNRFRNETAITISCSGISFAKILSGGFVSFIICDTSGRMTLASYIVIPESIYIAGPLQWRSEQPFGRQPVATAYDAGCIGHP